MFALSVICINLIYLLHIHQTFVTTCNMASIHAFCLQIAGKAALRIRLDEVSLFPGTIFTF